MAKAKRVNDRSANDMGADRAENRRHQNGPAPLTVRNGRSPNGTASDDTAPNGAAPNGAAATGAAPNGHGGAAPTNGVHPAAAVPGQGPVPGGEPQGTTSGFGTPVKVDEIAVAAMALSENLLAATRGLSESVAGRKLRRDLDEAADTFRAVAGELEATAGSLVRLAATEGQPCGVSWGICEDHGLTLMSVGEVVTCHVLGCHREQQAVVERCTQPVAYRVVDVAGPALLTCAGHAIACRVHLDGAVITLATDSLELL
ncbi:hypothetical protein [Kribbella sp. CA-294648]|uniref:hypothetical protein n=1 Tax=Kribbella sp. CA-294648 TaxID=3239948 RepID=UPI003D8A45A9